MKENISKVERQRKFVEIFKKDVFPNLKGHEVLRKRIQKKIALKKYLAIGIPFAFVLLSLFNLMRSDSDAFLNFIIFITLLTLLIVFFLIFSFAEFNDEKKFRYDLKNFFLKRLLDAFGKIEWSNGLDLISDVDLKSSELFADYNVKKHDDGFSGTYKDIDFKVLETHLLRKVKTSKGEYNMTMFKGVILEFSVDKFAKTHAIVSTKGDLTARDNDIVWLSVMLTLTMKPILEYWFDGYHKVAIGILIVVLLIFVALRIRTYISNKQKNQEEIILEDVKFGKKFHVYSDNQVEARCIVTPVFMEKFLNLNTAFGAKNAKCAFYRNKVMFAITTFKNLFEIGEIDSSLLDPKTFKKLFDELDAIYEIIDYFNLDKK